MFDFECEVLLFVRCVMYVMVCLCVLCVCCVCVVCRFVCVFVCVLCVMYGLSSSVGRAQDS